MIDDQVPKREPELIVGNLFIWEFWYFVSVHASQYAKNLGEVESKYCLAQGACPMMIMNYDICLLQI